jgi:hypothetical protein
LLTHQGGQCGFKGRVRQSIALEIGSCSLEKLKISASGAVGL